MIGRRTLQSTILWLSLLMVGAVAASFDAGEVRAEELDATEREQAVQSLRDYQARFQTHRVEIDVRVRKDFRPAESEGPVWYDYKIVAADGWMYTEEDIGQPLGMEGGRSNARYTVKSVFDSGTERGTEVYIRDEGGVEQAERTCAPTGIQRLSSGRLAQAVGWIEFWSPFLRSSDSLMSPADVLESSPEVRRMQASDGQTRLVAMVILDDVIEYEIRYSDLPHVRMTAMRRTIPGRTEVTGEVRYQQNDRGFDEPHAIREIRRRIDQSPPRIDLIEESLVTRFSIRSPVEDEPMPVIEIPEGLRVIDDCPDDERVEAKIEEAVPSPSPEAN